MIRFRVLGRSVEIQTASEELEHDLSRLTANLPAPTSEPPDVIYRVERSNGGYTLRCGDNMWGDLKRGDVFARLETVLSRQLVKTTDFAVLHAAALARGDDVYLFAGCSGCGKTTLTIALLKRGFTFLSDEYAPLSLDGRSVEPCPIPLKVLRSTVRRLAPPPEVQLLEHGFFAKGEDVFYGLPAPGRIAAPGRWRLARLYFPWNRPELSTQAYRLQPAVAVAQTMAQILNALRLGEQAFRLATDLVASVPCVNLVVGDIDAACQIVCDHE